MGNAYDHAALVVNELVTNAVRHACTSCRLDIRLDARGCASRCGTTVPFIPLSSTTRVTCRGAAPDSTSSRR